MEVEKLKRLLLQTGLKITPQRMVVLDAVMQLNHPSADQIIDFIKTNYPNIGVGTVYNILDTLVEKHVIIKVKTEKDIMRYDAILEKHHHLYSANSDRIEDYFDEELNDLITLYFNKKNIPNFKVEDIKLQIIGTFTK